MGGVKGPIGEIRAFAKQVGGLKEAGRTIAKVAAPKVAARVDAQISAQQTPYGVGWVPSKSGAPVLSGAASQISVSLTAGGKGIKISLAYPLAFHNDGTHGSGKKTQRKMRRDLAKQGYSKLGIRGVLKDFNKARKNASNVHDPARPSIPNEGEGIPAAWSSDVLDAAREVMAKGGAELRGG